MKKILLLYVLALVAFSCDDDDAGSAKLTRSTLAMVQYSGAIAADGCGWLLAIDSGTYKPTNLPEIYENDGLFIVSTFNILSEREACGLNQNGPQRVNIQKLPNDNTVEVFWDQTQCADPWNTDKGIGSDKGTAEALADYLAERNINVFSISFVDYAARKAFCAACSCHTGKRIYVRIFADDLDKATELGFTASACTTRDPMENVSWLKELQGQLLASAQPAGTRITQYQYNEECVFLVDLCYQCEDGLQTVYNYQKEKICEFGGITGINTCPDFFEQATGELVIWDNVTTENLQGKWHMLSHECCLLSQESFSRDQIVWEFLPDGTVKVAIKVALPENSPLPITADGSFDYVTNTGKLTVNNITYDLRFESGVLVLSDSPESDGPIIRFVR